MTDPLPLPEMPVEAPPPREPFWGYLDLLLFLGIGFGFLILLAIPFVVVQAVNPVFIKNNTIAVGLILQGAMYAALFFSWMIIFSVRYHRPVFPSLGWRATTFRLPTAALGGVALALGIGVLMKLLHTPEESLLDNLVNSRWSLLGIALLAVAAAPVFEEALFRGFLQPLLSRTFGVAAGIGITAVLFGILHTSEYKNVWQYPVAITLVGALFGWVRYRSGSLIPSTVMHACFNSVAVVGLIVSKYPKLK